MNNMNALPADITDQIERMQLDDNVKKVHLVVLSDMERRIVYKCLRAAASVFGIDSEEAAARILLGLAERFSDQPDDEESALDPSLQPLTANRW